MTPQLPNPHIELDFKDPGYNMTTPWQVGDGWDWESNHSRYRTMRVVGSRDVNGHTHFQVLETSGKIGNPPNTRVTGWVNATSWLRVNATDVQGWLTTFTPGMPLRYLRNGSYSYNETRFDGSGEEQGKLSVLANVAYVNNGVVVRLPWGNTATGKLDHRVLSLAADRTQTRTQITHWVSRDYAQSVQFQINLDETYVLVAAKVGNRTHRELLPT